MENNQKNNTNQQYPRIKEYFPKTSPDDVQGYVVWNELGMFLTVDYQYRPYRERDERNQGYVFRAERALELLEEAQKEHWQYQPITFSPATWYASANVVLYEGAPLTVEQFREQVQND